MDNCRGTSPARGAKGIRILHTLKVPILDARGNPQYLVGLSEDITERKLAEEEASRTRAFLDSVVENILRS